MHLLAGICIEGREFRYQRNSIDHIHLNENNQQTMNHTDIHKAISYLHNLKIIHPFNPLLLLKETLMVIDLRYPMVMLVFFAIIFQSSLTYAVIFQSMSCNYLKTLS
jgi:hypothetical protein